MDMKMSFLFLFFTFLSFSIIGQVKYNVNIDDRNRVIDMNAKAAELIREAHIDQAIDILTQSVSIDSVLRETYILLFQAWKEDKDCGDQVIQLLSKGKRIFKRDDELCFYVGEIYRNCSKFPEAVLEYTNAMVYAKENGSDFHLVPYYYMNRATCFYKMKMYDGAIDDYTEVLKLQPEYGAVYLNRGVCFYLSDKKNEACSDWEKAEAAGYHEALEYMKKYCGK